MPENPATQRTEDFVAAGERAGIPISEEHARLAAKSSDSLVAAIEALRRLEYQDHEPSNVFNPVVLDGGSDDGNER